MAGKTSFALDESTKGFIRDQVEKGNYHTGSEVIREAVRRMKANMEKEESLLARLDHALRQHALDQTHEEVWAEVTRPSSAP